MISVTIITEQGDTWRYTTGDGSFSSQNSGVVCGVPATPQPSRPTTILTVQSSSSLCHLKGQMRMFWKETIND